MNYLEIQTIIEDVERFIDSVKRKHGLDIAVSVLSGDKLYDVNKFADIVGYLRKNKRRIKKSITLYDIDFAVITALNNPEVKTVKDISGRRRPDLYYRQIFCFLARDYEFTYQKIGGFIRKDHTTVMHSTKLIQDLLHVRDPDIVRIYNRIYANLELLINPYITENEQTISAIESVSDISQ